ncbi:hypothetical protein KDW_03030 [Dictyobacter vulcani]|uniref:Uncharacterized protein n=1 Tax=Dictyobacter vulcani TaxID=2607529 RepID=A0A5J4KJ07_9CHLR|nr:hypothetical protein [Dictyobacter vulcani]GER86141.1 hypothetical protein KDW_03030 [Dictyobacter vulcani]
MQRYVTYCDCCGLSIASSQDCPRCGYPTELTKEKHFLEQSLLDLGRVVTFGGAALSISDLMSRYQRRLSYLSKVQNQPVAEAKKQASDAEESPISSQASSSTGGELTTPAVSQEPASNPLSPPRRAQTRPLSAPAAKSAFSFQDFFADQSINIVASLGAFLILVGSLSFIATTSDLLLAFLVLLGVHAFFGATGAITFRFPQVRIVSIIYTAIFALQVPLVGFSFYRMVSDIQLTPAMLIAIAATYATLAYGSLAIYQRFQPFGYLAAVSLAVTDVAVAAAFHLQVYWWPCIFLLLAFPMLGFVRRAHAASPSNNSGRELLRKPGLFLLYASVAVSVCIEILGSFVVYLFGLLSHTIDRELRFSCSVFLFVLLIWVCLYIWQTRKYMLAQLVPYLLLVWICSLLALIQVAIIGFILVLTILAACYWYIARQLLQGSGPFKAVVKQLDILVVALVVLVAYLSDPAIILQLFFQTYQYPLMFTSSLVTGMWFPVVLVTLFVGSALLCGVVSNHVGWRKSLTREQVPWTWLLLLAGLILNDAYAQVLLGTHLPLSWGLCWFALGAAGAACFVYRWTHNTWAYPLAILALCVALESIMLGLGLPTESLIALLLLYIISSYALAYYLRQNGWLLLPIGLALISLYPLTHQVSLFLLLSLLTPLLASGFGRWEKRRSATLSMGNGKALSRSWAAYVLAVLYGVAFGLLEYSAPQAILSNWFSFSAAFTLELALLASVWYVAAAIDDGRLQLVIATLFGLVALLMPGNQYWWLTGVAVVTLLLAITMRRLATVKWALPWYVVAIGAALMMGIQGTMQGWSQAASWSLLFFALLVYLTGVIERNELLQVAILWISVVLACWAIYMAGVVGDFYRPPVLTLTFAVVGVGVRSLRSGFFDASIGQQRHHRIRYVLPLYTTALFAAILTGIQGMFKGVNVPFYAAIPLFLFFYALTAYSISLLERKKSGLWLVALFIIWGMLLLPSIVTCSRLVQLPIIGGVNCQQQTQLVLAVLTSGVLLYCILGAIILRLERLSSGLALRSWGWIWYVMALCDVVIISVWSEGQRTNLSMPVMVGMFALFTILAFCVMALERLPELSVLVALLAIWTIVHLSIPLWGQLELMSIFFLALFATQYIWSIRSPLTFFVPATLVSRAIPLLGQFLVVFFAGLFVFNGGAISHAGAISLLVLAVLVAWWGWLQTEPAHRHRAFYVVGFLCSLTISWELWALGQAELTLLCASPAVYFIVIAPFISRDEKIAEHENVGQLCSIAGACLLLGPTLVLSFQYSNVAPSLLLTGESILLLLLGFITRIRVFVLSSAALVIVAAIHVLFLPSLGIPTFMALFLLGILLVVLATTLLLVRTRLAAFWAHAD